MSYCPQCGTEAFGNFCGNCGSSTLDPNASIPAGLSNRLTQSEAPSPGSSFSVELLLMSTGDVVLRQNRNALITTSPVALVAFYGVRAISNRYLKQKAQADGQQRWKPLGKGKAVIDSHGVYLAGEWGRNRYAYKEFIGWERLGDGLLLRVDDSSQILLRSPEIEALIRTFVTQCAGQLGTATELETWASPPRGYFPSWDQRDPRFKFGIPLGWAPFSEPDYFRRTTDDLALGGHELLLMLSRTMAPYDVYLEVSEIVDPEFRDAAVSSPDFFVQCGKELLAIQAARFADAVTVPPRTVLVDREPAAMLAWRGNVPGFQVAIAQFWLCHDPPFMIGFNVTSREDPTPAFDSIFPEVQAVIASWRWT